MAANGGRKTKLTPDLQARIVQVLEAGNYIEAACAYVGIGESTFNEWVERGTRGGRRGKNEAYAEFAEAVKRARAQAEVASVARIRKAGMEGEWQADAWYLERSYPGRWGKREHKVEHEGKVVIEVVYGNKNSGLSSETPSETA